MRTNMMERMMGDAPISVMRMMGMDGMAGMATIDHVEGRIAFLRTELQISDAQVTVWADFADALRANAKRLGEVRASMNAPSVLQARALAVADRLEFQEQWLAARLEGTRAIKIAVVNLFDALADDQKIAANQLLAPHMGLGMMPMLP
jgi:LTXXQ motif family protein